MKSLKSQNYYDVLGVPRQASPEEIRSAYEISRHTFQENSLATYSLFSDQENQEILALIAKAFETLFNPESRRAYDAVLLQQEGEPPPLPVRRTGPGNGTGTAAPSHAGQTSLPGVHTAAARPRPPVAQMTPAEPARPAPPTGTPVPLFRTSSQPQATITPSGPKPAPVPDAPAPNPAKDEYVKTVVRYDGAVLKKLRLIYGMSLEDLAERSKIRRAYLEYIEEENFQFLPAAVYVKGFVTLMATIYGLPVQRVAEEYMQIFRAKKA
jgi:Helix-turn-helix domain/DnaJ domain